MLWPCSGSCQHCPCFLFVEEPAFHGEGIVADWLRSYEKPLPPALCRAPADADQLIFASFWCGRDGCFPGTGGAGRHMFATGSRLTTLLKQANVLDGEGKLQLEAAGRMFEDLCCVMGSSLQCSCSVYA